MCIYFVSALGLNLIKQKRRSSTCLILFRVYIIVGKYKKRSKLDIRIYNVSIIIYCIYILHYNIILYVHCPWRAINSIRKINLIGMYQMWFFVDDT